MKGSNRIAGVAIALFLTTTAGIAAELIGTIVPPLPVGIIKDGGVCIGRTEAAMCERSIATVKTSAGRVFLIYTGSAEPRQGNKARWRVTDTLAFPKVRKGNEFVWWECRKSGVPDPSIMAIVQSSAKREWLRARDWAYQVDYNSGKFIALEPASIDCSNPALENED